jgi:hypothetical protein
MMPRFSIAALAAAALISTAPTTPAVAQYEDQAVQFFLAADADGDELLTLQEFRVFIQQMANAGAPMSVRIQQLAAYRVAFARVDANGDGLATPAELRAAEASN